MRFELYRCKLIRVDEFHWECACGDWHMIQVVPDKGRAYDEWFSHKMFRKSRAETARRLDREAGHGHPA